MTAARFAAIVIKTREIGSQTAVISDQTRRGYQAQLHRELLQGGLALTTEFIPM
jgi:hypothetical protein